MIIRITKLRIFSFVALLMLAALTAAVLTESVSVTADGDTVKLPVLMYHQITKEPSLAGKHCVTTTELENDLAYLKRNGYNTITVTELLNAIDFRSPLPDNPVMITFDDGQEAVLEYLLPLLKKYDMKAVAAIIGSATDLFTQTEDHHLRYSHLTWDEINTLIKSRRVEIQNHSYDMHTTDGGRYGMRKKAGESIGHYSSALSADLTKLQNEIKEHTGTVPQAVMYPYGAYSDETDGIVEGLGFRIAFTCEGKPNLINLRSKGFLTLGRYNRPSGESSESFLGRVLE